MYTRIAPVFELQDIIKEYWIIEDDTPVSEIKKIIPDGFPEIIIHYKDPYRIRLGRDWEVQSTILFAGQITKHFYLENTGRSGMIGIKLMPWAAFQLLEVEMNKYTDKVVPLQQVFGSDFRKITEEIQTGLHSDPAKKITLTEEYIFKLINEKTPPDLKKIPQAIKIILDRKGLIKIKEIAEKLKVSRRHLERNFKIMIGISPKFYCRIIRFNYIFEIMKEASNSWIEIALESGYFDQSHFIKDFKEFTGEEPSAYGFDEKNMANFFLKKE